MINGIEEIISGLYNMIQEAWSLPLGAEKCVIERDKVLDMLDSISAQLPNELKQARTIVDTRNEIIGNAKREAENIVRQAQEQAANMVKENEIYKQAQIEARRISQECQQKNAELRRVANAFVEDALKTTEESIAKALGDVKNSRAKFNALTGNNNQAPSPIIEDI